MLFFTREGSIAESLKSVSYKILVKIILYSYICHITISVDFFKSDNLVVCLTEQSDKVILCFL